LETPPSPVEVATSRADPDPPRGRVRGKNLPPHVPTRLWIDDREAAAAEVDEAFLACPMDLSHREREALRPGRVPRAELAVLVPVGLRLAVLLPEELLGHVRAALLPTTV
jgi:hypothetical protein